MFSQIARMLKIKEENPFKIRAYEKIALILENLLIDIETIYQQGGINNIRGLVRVLPKRLWIRIYEFRSRCSSLGMVGRKRYCKYPASG